MPQKALVHVSGGYDSAAAFADAVDNAAYDSGVVPWFCDYGQPCSKEERAAATYLVTHYRRKYAHVRELQVAHVDLHLSGSRSEREEYFPMRTFALTAMSVNWAMAFGCDHVLVGARCLHHRPGDGQRDNCKPVFDWMNLAVSTGTEDCDMPVTIRMPLGGWSKTMALMRLLEDGVVLRQLWSCYCAGANPCGQCQHCDDLRRALGPRAPLVFGDDDDTSAAA